MFGSFWSALFGGLFGKKKKTPGARGGTGLLRSSGVSRALHLVGQTDIDDEGVGAGARLGTAALPWKTAGPGGPRVLGESPAAAPAAKTPGMIDIGDGQYIGEEEMDKPEAERVPLSPEEVARRRKAFKPERSRYAAKRRETLLGEAKERQTLLAGLPKPAWRTR